MEFAMTGRSDWLFFPNRCSHASWLSSSASVFVSFSSDLSWHLFSIPLHIWVLEVLVCRKSCSRVTFFHYLVAGRAFTSGLWKSWQAWILSFCIYSRIGILYKSCQTMPLCYTLLIFFHASHLWFFLQAFPVISYCTISSVHSGRQMTFSRYFRGHIRGVRDYLDGTWGSPGRYLGRILKDSSSKTKRKNIKTVKHIICCVSLWAFL